MLSADGRHIEQLVGYKNTVQALSVGGISMEEIFSFFVEDAQARKFTLVRLFHRLITNQVINFLSCESEGGELIAYLYVAGDETASSMLTWKSQLNSEPKEEYHGNSQPMRFLYCSIFAIGARETSTKVVLAAFK